MYKYFIIQCFNSFNFYSYFSSNFFLSTIPNLFWPLVISEASVTSSSPALISWSRAPWPPTKRPWRTSSPPPPSPTTCSTWETSVGSSMESYCPPQRPWRNQLPWRGSGFMRWAGPLIYQLEGTFIIFGGGDIWTCWEWEIVPLPLKKKWTLKWKITINNLNKSW